MRRTPSSGCYWGFVLCLRDTLYLFLAIAIIAYALRQIKFTQLLYFLYVSLNFLRNFYFYAFYTFFFFFYLFIRHIDIYMFPMINFLKNLQRKGGFFYEQIQAFRCFYFKFRSCTRACLKNKNCTKRMFYFPFHDKIKKKGGSLC